MRLESFRVTNFRSINDSGDIDVTRITALLGRNESGKSNLLRALHSLNPAEGFKALNAIKDFPRHRRLEECNDSTPVVSSTWSLDAEDRTELAEILSRAASVQRITVERRYGGEYRYISFLGLDAQSVDEADVKAKSKKIVAAVKAAADGLEDAAKAKLESAADTFESGAVMLADRTAWATNAVKAIADLRKALAGADRELSQKQEQLVMELPRFNGQRVRYAA